MPTYDSSISRTGTLGTDTDPLVPEPMVAEVIQEATQSSAALSLCRQVKMTAGTVRQPVLSALPVAFWVAEGGLKQTSSAEWENVQLVAEEAAVIVPIPESYIADSGIPIWAEVKPMLGQAIAKILDDAVIFGTGAPGTFGDSIFTVADNAGNSVTAGTGDDLAVDVAALGELLATQGFSARGFMARPGFQWNLVGLRSSAGVPIYQPTLQGSPGAGLYGFPLHEVLVGAWDETSAELIAGDFSKAAVGVRQDISVRLFDQGVISDGSGAVVTNLMQQDMVAMRVTARFGFATANPVTPLGSSGAPFAYLAPAGS